MSYDIKRYRKENGAPMFGGKMENYNRQYANAAKMLTAYRNFAHAIGCSIGSGITHDSIECPDLCRSELLSEKWHRFDKPAHTKAEFLQASPASQKFFESDPETFNRWWNQL
jgi:hypothetical protein